MSRSHETFVKALLCAAAVATAAPLAVQAQATTTAVTRPTPAAQTTYAVRNATIVPVVGARIQNGTIVVRGERIVAVGANVQVPADATIIDGTGMFVYPGLIDSGTQLGLTEIASVPGGTDTREIGDFNPHNRALTAVNPHSELIPVTRVNGVTTVLTGATGGMVNGQAALIDLNGWTPEEMAAKPRAAMVMSYPGAPAGFFFATQSQTERTEVRDRQVRELRNYLRDAKAHAEVEARIGSGDRGGRPRNAAMDAMIPVVRGEIPAIFDVQTEEQIRGVLQLADTFGIKVILRGAREAWKVADQLAARRIPVIVGPTTSVPGPEDPYDMVYANPGVLARAGVQIAFQTDNASDSRNLPYNAALATAYGLDPDEALRALTINAARIWGVENHYGSLENGKMANLFVSSGDPLDVRTEVRHVFIRGRLLPMDDRHTKLYERFKARPLVTPTI